jgi:predicted neutral ceramidase superfamily lipid hydrolase
MGNGHEGRFFDDFFDGIVFIFELTNITYGWAILLSCLIAPKPKIAFKICVALSIVTVAFNPYMVTPNSESSSIFPSLITQYIVLLFTHVLVWQTVKNKKPSNI